MTEEKQESPAPGRTTSGKAAAARRARRIGGRPATAGTPGTDTAPTASAPATTASATTASATTASATTAAPTRPRPDRSAPATAPVSIRKRGSAAGPADDAAPAATTSPAGVAAQPGTAEIPVVVQTVTPAWLNWLPAAVLSAGALALAVLILVFSNGVWWGPSPGAAPTGAQAPNAVRERVLAAAKTCIASTNSYKYTALDAFEKKALSCSTGQFTSQLQNTIETLIKVNAPKLKSSQTAQINRGGIEAVTSDGRQWTVLLFGQLTVVNTNDSKGHTDPFAAQVTMQKAGNKWLIAHLSTVSSPLS
jgi:hypothetical protein